MRYDRYSKEIEEFSLSLSLSLPHFIFLPSFLSSFILIRLDFIFTGSVDSFFLHFQCNNLSFCDKKCVVTMAKSMRKKLFSFGLFLFRIVHIVINTKHGLVFSLLMSIPINCTWCLVCLILRPNPSWQRAQVQLDVFVVVCVAINKIVFCVQEMFQVINFKRSEKPNTPDEWQP